MILRDEPLQKRRNRLLVAAAAAGLIVFGATSCGDAGSSRATSRQRPPVVREPIERLPSTRQAAAPGARPERDAQGARGLYARVLTASESVVYGMRVGDPPIFDGDGRPLAYSDLPRVDQLKFDAEVRGFARALLANHRVETRSSLAQMANSARLHDAYSYTFDATTGDVDLEVRLLDGTGHVVFNTDRLAAAAASGRDYRSKRLRPLEP